MSSENEGAAKVNDCRAAINRHFDQILAQPVSANLTAIAALYSAHDMATVLMKGNPQMAMKWMRGALDILERDLAAQSARNGKAPSTGGEDE